MGDTAISWTDVTWNPIRGCSRYSEGCRHCYAEVQAARIVRMGRGKPTLYDGLVNLVGGEPRWTGKVALDPRKLAEPLRWRTPRKVFVNSMSDLFHESLTNEQIAAVYGVMAACPQHTFQILTKRARRMREWFAWLESTADINGTMHVEAGPCIADAIGNDPAIQAGHRICDAEWPLPNVWLGVSVENQAAADERIPELMRTPAALRFLSCEPLLGKIDLRRVRPDPFPIDALTGRWSVPLQDGSTQEPRIHWVIAGCESGPGARPCATAWLRSLRDQCAEAGVPYFLKQAHPWTWVEGERAPGHAKDDGSGVIAAGTGSHRKPGGVIELPYLDGVQHAAFPEVTRG